MTTSECIASQLLQQISLALNPLNLNPRQKRELHPMIPLPCTRASETTGKRKRSTTCSLCHTLVHQTQTTEDLHFKFWFQFYLHKVIATIAFGLGLDCPDVHQIAHAGLSEDIESYSVCTRNRLCRERWKPALATLLKVGTYHPCEKTTKDYAANTTVCNRDVLFESMKNIPMRMQVSNVCAVTFLCSVM